MTCRRRLYDRNPNRKYYGERLFFENGIVIS